MSRRFRLLAQTFPTLLLGVSCAAPLSTNTEAESADPSGEMSPEASSSAWIEACQPAASQLPASVPDWWIDWADALQGGDLQRASGALLAARSTAAAAFHDALGDETPSSGSGANGPELRDWTLTWVQSATPLLVIDPRGFVWSDAVVCAQARETALAGDTESALAWLSEARPFLRPGSCAARCETAIRGD